MSNPSAERIFDAIGESRAIRRPRGADRLEAVRRLAEDHASVAGGRFDVRVRSWRVVRSGLGRAGLPRVGGRS